MVKRGSVGFLRGAGLFSSSALHSEFAVSPSLSLKVVPGMMAHWRQEEGERCVMPGFSSEKLKAQKSAGELRPARH